MTSTVDDEFVSEDEVASEDESTSLRADENVQLPESITTIDKTVEETPTAALGKAVQRNRKQHQTYPSATVQAAMDGLSISSSVIAALRAAGQIDSGALDALRHADLSTNAIAALRAAGQIDSGALDALRLAARQPGLRDWSEALGRTLTPTKAPKVRRQRKAPEFFAAFEAQVGSVSELLRALAVIQEKNSHLGLVWRGQQNADWAVDSSLTRRLRGDGHELGEEEMVAVERFQVGTARQWGLPHVLGDLHFLAELQHEGVPTRLVDVSLDPEVAVWFAVQESKEQGEADGRLIAWGRSAAPKRDQDVAEPAVIHATGGEAFWQFWPDREARKSNQWGTGTSVPSWQPTALNERMRAQRAAFLFDAEPIIGPKLLEMFNRKLDSDWRAGEIAEATRIVGFPSPHDRRAKPNHAGIVPMFTLRISASAKSDIRAYLERKGLAESTIYPDRAGLVSFLRRMSAR